MKILVLYNRIPFPLNDGGNLAVHSILKGLKNAGHCVHLLAMNTHRHWVEPERINQTLDWLDSVTSIYVDNRIKVGDAAINLIKNQSYHLSRFINTDFEQALVDLLNKETFDIVHLEGLYVTPYIATISKISKVPIVYRQHNIEYKIWEHAAKETKNYLKKVYLKLLSKQLKNYEIKLLKHISYLLPISKDEAKENYQLGFNGYDLWIPFGVENGASGGSTTMDYTKIYHIGAMDWLPNEQGIDWFIENVWNKVVDVIPAATFYFAGRNMPDRFMAYKGPNIFCLGTVEDAKVFEADKGILVVPLHTAAGIRIKTLNALIQGKVVISTSTGAKGLDLEHGKQLLVADGAREFADCIIQVIQDPILASSLSEGGQKWVQDHYDNKVLINKINDFYEKIINQTLEK